MKKKLLRIMVVGLIFTSITTTASAFTAVMSGDWGNAATWGGTSPGGSISNEDINIPAGITVNMNMDVAYTGGILNSFTVNGTLHNASPHSLTFSGTFAGSGSVTLDRITFSGLLTSLTFTGTMTVGRFENMGSNLNLAAVISVSDTLNMDSGAIILGSGANLSMLANSVVRVNDGTITATTGVFTAGSSYTVMYLGSSKTSGIELSETTVDDLYVQLDDNTQTLTLGGNLVVNGDAHLNAGYMNFNGRQLTFNGDVMMGSGVFLTSNGTSTLTVGGSSSLTNALGFTSGSSLSELTISNSGSGNVKLISNMSIGSDLRLMDGELSIEAGSTLTMSTGSTIHVQNGSMVLNSTGMFDGTNAYSVEYIGGTITSGLELTGSGLNNLTVDLAATTDELTINNDITVDGAFDLNYGRVKLNGNTVIIAGSFNQDNSAVFIGSSSSELELNMTTSANDTLNFSTGSGENVLSKLTLNTGSASTVYLGSDLSINDQLALTNAKLDIGDNDLTISSSGSVSNYNEDRYIITSGSGQLSMTVNNASTYVTFPVGTMTGYSPANIQQTAVGSTGAFMVHTADGVYADGSTSGWSSSASGSMVNRTWWISAGSGVTVNTNIKLGWETSEEVNGFDRSNAYITHYTGGAWDTYSFDAATATSFGYEIERTGLTSLSPFAVIDSIAGISIGIEENATPVSMSLYPNPATNQVNIAMNNSSDEYSYELLDITGSVLKAATNKNTLNTFDVSNLSMGYYFIRATNTTTKEVITKRIVKN